MIVDSIISFVGCIFNFFFDFLFVGGFDIVYVVVRYFLDYFFQFYIFGLGFVYEWDKESFFFFFLNKYRVYDWVVIKFRGVDVDINFIVGDYEEDMKQVFFYMNVVLVYIFVLCDFFFMEYVV